MDERTLERHSVNCYYCDELFDERESYGTTPDGGDVCPKCGAGMTFDEKGVAIVDTEE